MDTFLLSYHAITNSWLFPEMLRLWPPAIAMDRICLKDYNAGKPNSKATEDFIVSFHHYHHRVNRFDDGKLYYKHIRTGFIHDRFLNLYLYRMRIISSTVRIIWHLPDDFEILIARFVKELASASRCGPSTVTLSTFRIPWNLTLNVSPTRTNTKSTPSLTCLSEWDLGIALVRHIYRQVHH